MSYPKEFQERLKKELKDLKDSGRYKDERVILSPQAAEILVKSGKVLNFCANNYLGLTNDARVIEAAKKSLDEWAYGTSSVRFICGTQQPHKVLEEDFSEFLGTEDTILYVSCAAANMGLIQPLLGFEDVVISDRLNHATIIDAIKLWQGFHKKKVDREELKEELVNSIGRELTSEFSMFKLEKLFSHSTATELNLKTNHLITEITTKHKEWLEKFLEERLAKAVIPAESRVFKHSDMDDLEKQLKETQNKRTRLICTDGAFSMDGNIAKLDKICQLAEKYNALVMVDDSHATGFVGKTGRGTHEYRDVMGKVDIITSTMGKALGGACGGFTSGRKEIIELLRQTSREYIFSNTIPPVIADTTIEILYILSGDHSLRDKLEENTKHFRQEMTKLGFDIKPGTHPIVPIMLYETKPAKEMADRLLGEGIFVIAFPYPVVPEGQDRIRVQISAAHSPEDIKFALGKFAKVGRELGIIK